MYAPCEISPASVFFCLHLSDLPIFITKPSVCALEATPTEGFKVVINKTTFYRIELVRYFSLRNYNCNYISQ